MSADPDPGTGSPGRSSGPRDWPRQALVLLVRAWQLVVSPWYPPVCRFYPSCSSYAVQALGEHGALRGSWLTARRLLRCHPWNPGGVDHVPRRADGERPCEEQPAEPIARTTRPTP